MKKISLFLLIGIVSSSLHAQLSLTKMVGKNAAKYRLGYDLFSFYDFPLNSDGNYKSIRLELMDLAFFPGKDGKAFTTASAQGYLSIKLGYKNIFSETKTGFYVEPSVGYCRVVDAPAGASQGTFGDGIAGAMEAGYNLEVGQNGHELTFGLKYETDRAGAAHTISSVGFRFSYSFNLFRKKED